MTLDEIAQLAARLQNASIDTLDLELSGCSLKLRWAPQSATLSSPPLKAEPLLPPTPTTTIIKSPRMGLFLESHPLDRLDAADQATQPARVGQAVCVGDILGYIQAEAVFVAIRAPVAGTVHQVHVSPDEVVGYAQPIFSLTLS